MMPHHKFKRPAYRHESELRRVTMALRDCRSHADRVAVLNGSYLGADAQMEAIRRNERAKALDVLDMSLYAQHMSKPENDRRKEKR